MVWSCWLTITVSESVFVCRVSGAEDLLETKTAGRSPTDEWRCSCKCTCLGLPECRQQEGAGGSILNAQQLKENNVGRSFSTSSAQISSRKLAGSHRIRFRGLTLMSEALSICIVGSSGLVNRDMERLNAQQQARVQEAPAVQSGGLRRSNGARRDLC